MPSDPPNSQDMRDDIFGLSFLWKDFDHVHGLNVEKLGIRREMQQLLARLSLDSFELTDALPPATIVEDSEGSKDEDVEAWKKLFKRHHANDAKRQRYIVEGQAPAVAPRVIPEVNDEHRGRIKALVKRIKAIGKDLEKERDDDEALKNSQKRLDEEVVVLKTLLEKSGTTENPSQLSDLKKMKGEVEASEERLRKLLGPLFDGMDAA